MVVDGGRHITGSRVGGDEYRRHAKSELFIIADTALLLWVRDAVRPHSSRRRHVIVISAPGIMEPNEERIWPVSARNEAADHCSSETFAKTHVLRTRPRVTGKVRIDDAYRRQG